MAEAFRFGLDTFTLPEPRKVRVIFEKGPGEYRLDYVGPAVTVCGDKVTVMGPLCAQTPPALEAATEALFEELAAQAEEQGAFWACSERVLRLGGDVEVAIDLRRLAGALKGLLPSDPS